jgi:hypothetical protein
MSLQNARAQQLKRLEKKLMEMTETNFNYHFYPVDTNTSGIDANGQQLAIHRRLARLGINHDLFVSQQDYYNWYSKMQKDYRDSLSGMIVNTDSPQTNALQGRKNRYSAGIFNKDLPDGDGAMEPYLDYKNQPS